MTTKININEKFSKFSEHWRPKIVAELNGQARSDRNPSGGWITTQRGWRLRQPSLNVASRADVETKHDAPIGEWV